MRNTLKVIWCILNLLRTVPVWGICSINKNCKSKILKDTKVWGGHYNELGLRSTIMLFTYIIVFYPEFRNVIIARLQEQNVVFYPAVRLLIRPVSTLFINSLSIEEGLFIHHGFATIINAKHIGSNCWINQQVTIGSKTGNETPTIGNHVVICAGAIVIGDISIGDNVVIGAGAVVTKSIPSGETWAGNPAHKIK